MLLLQYNLEKNPIRTLDSASSVSVSEEVENLIKVATVTVG